MKKLFLLLLMLCASTSFAHDLANRHRETRIRDYGLIKMASITTPASLVGTYKGTSAILGIGIRGSCTVKISQIRHKYYLYNIEIYNKKTDRTYRFKNIQLLGISEDAKQRSPNYSKRDVMLTGPNAKYWDKLYYDKNGQVKKIAMDNDRPHAFKCRRLKKFVDLHKAIKEAMRNR